MEIHTSYFARVKALQERGYDNLICVAGYAPKFFYDTPNARFYPDLAPRKSWFLEWRNKHLSNDWYIERYNETVLDKLNPLKVVEELGNNAVMLCYEKPGDFCHRHLIADWIAKNTGIQVDEIKF